MKLYNLIFTILIWFSLAPVASASLNLNIKIGQMVGSQIIEINRTVASEYNKEIIISPEGFKNKIILNLKKFSNVLVNGNKISPVQIDMKLVNEMKKIIGKTQTVTSFYNKSAEFAVPSTGIASDAADINVSLKFEETN